MMAQIASSVVRVDDSVAPSRSDSAGYVLELVGTATLLDSQRSQRRRFRYRVYDRYTWKGDLGGLRREFAPMERHSIRASSCYDIQERDRI